MSPRADFCWLGTSLFFYFFLFYKDTYAAREFIHILYTCKRLLTHSLAYILNFNRNQTVSKQNQLKPARKLNCFCSSEFNCDVTSVKSLAQMIQFNNQTHDPDLTRPVMFLFHKYCYFRNRKKFSPAMAVVVAEDRVQILRPLPYL